MTWAGRRYWLVGASEGLGAALARKLSAAGVELVLSARHADRLQSLARELPGRARVVAMDVRDDASVAGAARAAGRIDGVIYSAGAYWPMPATAWQAEQAVAMADVNFTGAVRVLGHVVPDMVARDSGHVLLIGSLAGFRGLPGSVGYGAAKAGLMTLAESLRADLWRTGVQVQLANPGFIRTRLTNRNSFRMPFLMEPDAAARRVFELMCTPERFQRHFPWAFSLVFRLSRLLPDGVYYRLFA